MCGALANVGRERAAQTARPPRGGLFEIQFDIFDRSSAAFRFLRKTIV